MGAILKQIRNKLAVPAVFRKPAAEVIRTIGAFGQPSVRNSIALEGSFDADCRSLQHGHATQTMS
jgi:hypothetical protein